MIVPINNYENLFNTLVNKTSSYLLTNNLKCMVLGISGGIDSTVVAAICHEVSKITGIPLIGRSLPTKFNKEGETTTANLVGKAFCTNYKEVCIETTYKNLQADLCGNECTLGFEEPQPTALTNGNIQARLRMIYLYNLAGMYRGLVMDTDNLTENNLGYFTIHGDVGDFNPIGCLWKTEVFKLAEWLFHRYEKADYTQLAKAEAMWASLQLKPTAGLGITDSDLDELGAESYEQVDTILQEIKAWEWFVAKRFDTFDSLQDMCNRFLDEQQMLDIPMNVIVNVARRHFNSEFKRNQLPIKITRNEI